MRFYPNQHRHTCGVDLHGRNLYLCILDQEGQIRLHKRLRCDPSSSSKPSLPTATTWSLVRSASSAGIGSPISASTKVFPSFSATLST